MALTKIISGGQTGADEGGLLAGKALGLATGGMMPQGWRTELRPRPEYAQMYGMVESNSPDYKPRTLVNIRQSNGTVVFGDVTSAGSRLTVATCKAMGKPYMVNPTPAGLRQFIELNKIQTLNVAGNRESKNIGIRRLVYDTIMGAYPNGR